jgi:spermidine synthase
MAKYSKSRPAPVAAGSKRFLYVTAAIAGGVLMVVEILGAKMLAPYLGTSHFVWVAQISVTMVALAFGYILGGKLADRTPRLGALYGGYLLAGFWCAASVPATEPVAFFALKFNLAFGSIVASTILFFVPLTLMAMTVPFLLRSVSQSLANLGTRLGTLSAVSTMGSFAGTAGVGYLMIPKLANSTTMLGCATVLVSLATIYFVVVGRGSRPIASLVVVWASLPFAGMLTEKQQAARLGGAEELFRGNSHFGLLQVCDVGPTQRYLLNDFLVQNSYDPTTRQSTATFTYMLSELARAYAPRIDSALCIGLGVGIVPMDFSAAGARVDVVEINPAIVPVAREFFDFDEKRVNLTIDDGRHVLNTSAAHYDVVILDAFLGDSSPSHLMSREAFASMRARMNPEGVLVINCFGDLTAGKDYFVGSLHRTLSAVFRSVKLHASLRGGLFFVASDQLELSRPIRTDFSGVHLYVREEVRYAYDNEVSVRSDAGIVLTDDYNPVEFFDAKNREELRKILAFSMKKS